MKLSRILVQNYRSIKEADVAPSRFAVFVGQNNHGKTNLFEAINWFFNAKSAEVDEHHGCKSENQIVVELFYTEVQQSDIDKLTTEGNRTKITNLLGATTEFSVRKTSASHKRSYFVGGEDKGNPAGLDAAINEFLPKLEYVSTRIRLADVSKYKDKNPIGMMLAGVLLTIIEDSEDYKAFREKFYSLFESDESAVRKQLDVLGDEVGVYLQKQFPDGTTVRFTVTPPQITDLLKSFDTDVDDGIKTKAEIKGDGMQRAIMLAIIQAFADYRKKQLGGGSFLFLIDEAELHLHPTAQRALKRALLDICRTDQVLVNTHSSVLVVDNHELQTLFCVRKDGHTSTIERIEDKEKQDVVFDLLGGSPGDLLLPRNFLIVEGRSDYEFLTAVVRRFYPTKYRGLKILFAGGDLVMEETTLWNVHRTFVPLVGSDNPIYRAKAVCLIDKPNAQQQANYQQFKNGYPFLFANDQVRELPTETLEEYYPAPLAKTATEAKVMKPNEKVEYAKLAAQEITQAQFESDMAALHGALVRCEELAFQPAS